MMDFIDPSAPKTKDYLRRTRNENQKERIAPYRPSIDKKLAKLFETTLPSEQNKPTVMLVDWSFLDKDNGQPGELADWVKKRIRMYEKWTDELHAEMLEDLKRDHLLTRNIEPPSTPKRYDPNGISFAPGQILDGTELDKEEWDDELDEE